MRIKNFTLSNGVINPAFILWGFVGIAILDAMLHATNLAS